MTCWTKREHDVLDDLLDYRERDLLEKHDLVER